MEVLKATVEPLGSSDPTVIWASSDETVAVVSGGVIKALAEGLNGSVSATSEYTYTIRG